MSRAEDIAIEYQLKTYGPKVIGGDNILSEEEYKIFNINKDYKNGYKQALDDVKKECQLWLAKTKSFVGDGEDKIINQIAAGRRFILENILSFIDNLTK